MSRADLEKTILQGIEVAAEEAPFRGTGCPCGHVVGWAAIRDIFGAELEPVWAGQKGVKEAVDTMIPLINDALQKYLKQLGLG
jgi:ABC-type glycerol-3-phosphate transport system substrate-binding protein